MALGPGHGAWDAAVRPPGGARSREHGTPAQPWAPDREEPGIARPRDGGAVGLRGPRQAGPQQASAGSRGPGTRGDRIAAPRRRGPWRHGTVKPWGHGLGTVGSRAGGAPSRARRPPDREAPGSWGHRVVGPGRGVTGSWGHRVVGPGRGAMGPWVVGLRVAGSSVALVRGTVGPRAVGTLVASVRGTVGPQAAGASVASARGVAGALRRGSGRRPRGQGGLAVRRPWARAVFAGGLPARLAGAGTPACGGPQAAHRTLPVSAAVAARR
jgi:hypothetical protein